MSGVVAWREYLAGCPKCGTPWRSTGWLGAGHLQCVETRCDCAPWLAQHEMEYLTTFGVPPSARAQIEQLRGLS